MTIALYIQAIEGLEAILETFTEDTEIYKETIKLKKDLIASQIPV